MIVQNGFVYNGHSFERKDLFIEGGSFASSSRDSRKIDAEGLYVVPGFWDIHTHGAMTIDVNAASVEDFRTLSRFFASHGVTRWLCSILTDSRERTLEAISKALEVIKDPQDGARLMGIHLEGPFLSPSYAGAMPPHLLIGGDVDLIKEYQDAAEGNIRMITLAPEVEGNLAVIERFSGEIAFAMGHSNATYAEAKAGLEKGARSITHTGNAMRLFHQHEPAILGLALGEDIYMEMIADGFHLHPDTVRMYFNIKGRDKLLAISDSISATGMPNGEYMLGINPIVVEDGNAMLRDKPVRAGSTLTLDKALKNIMKFTGRSMEEVLPTLGRNQSVMLGFGKDYGLLEEGYKADFLLLDGDGNLKGVFIEGKEYLN